MAMAMVFSISSRTGVSAWTTICRSMILHRQRQTPATFVSQGRGYFGSGTLSFRHFASQDDRSDDKDDAPAKITKKNKHPKKKKGQFTISDKITSNEAADKLAAAFDELARKEGFDSSLSFFADEARFDKNYNDDDIELQSSGEAEEEDEDFPSTGEAEENDDAYLFDKDAMMNDGDDELSDFEDPTDTELSMEDRIMAAKRDIVMGQVSVPEELDSFAQTAPFAHLQALGYQKEENPFGNDETPRKERFQLVTNAMICTACGSDFQSHNDTRPGYLPPEKFDLQVKLSKIEEMQKLVNKAEGEEWTTQDEVEWLIQTGGAKEEDKVTTQADVEALAEEMGLDLVKLAQEKTICKRCHGLQNFGKVDKALRPGWTKEPLLSQENFRSLLAPLKDKPAVIIALVDLFDFAGSVLPELDAIAGENPVILAANKADLLPSNMGKHRVQNWVRRELEYLGVKSIANIGGAVRLVSCKSGWGIQDMLEKARKLADEMDCDIYAVGAANAGKSTLLNQILANSSKKRFVGKKRAGNRNARRGAITTSPLPGTTLKFIQVKLEGGRNLYDTPGLLVPGTITQLLTPDELKIVVPTKQVEPISFRIESGTCVLVGALAKVELIGDSRPFLFTFFVANSIKLHLTKSEKASHVMKKHAGEMLTPPLPPGPERLEEIGEFEEHVLDVEGMGWKEAAADISLTGLGWVAITGSGSAQVRISVPKGIGVLMRPPLMPLDMWDVASRYTGSRSVRKTAKGRKGVGRM